MIAPTAPTQATRASSPLTAGDLGLKVLLCESVDGSEGQVSFLPVIAWVTLTEPVDGTPGVSLSPARWSSPESPRRAKRFGDMSRAWP